VPLHDSERNAIIELIESRTGLPQRIREVVLDRETPLFDKKREIAALIENELRSRGSFLRTSDGRGFFFSNSERRILDLEQTEFQHTLTEVSGLSATEAYFKFTLDVLQAKVCKTAPLAEIHTFAHFDLASGFLAVSDGAGGMWTRERGGDWREARNGEGGIFFLTEPEAVPFTPEFNDGGTSLHWFLKLFLFGREGLSPDDARVLLTVFVLHQFFPPLRQTRVIPAFLGPQGSGKTTAQRLIGRLLLGGSFEVTGVQRDREDAFVASVSNRVILGLDNADSRINWLPDALALYATGQRFRLRKLYTTNEEVSYAPRAILLLSSRDPRFNRPDVSERLLPLYFERPELYRPEHQIFSELESRRGAIMGEILQRVGEIADSLPSTEAKSLPFRMADFASFGARVFEPSAKVSEWVELLKKLESAQASFAGEGDGTLSALRLLLERGEIVEDMPVGDLFRKLRAIGEEHSLPLPKTAQGFGRYITTHKRVVELELGVDLTEVRHGGGLRAVTLRRRQP
jgi:hypothetical protein